MIVVRLWAYLRRHWPQTHILVRGERHCATPEVIDVIAAYRWTDGVFGLAQAHRTRPPASRRLYAAFPSAAASWAQPWRGLLTAEVLAAGDNPRLVGTSLVAPTPPRMYEALYCARGHGENAIKAVKGDLHSARTAATPFLAHARRLLLSCAAYGLHHALRTPTLPHTALAQAQPAPLLLTLFYSGPPDQAVPGPHPPPPPECLPRQSALTPCHRPALSWPVSHNAHIVRDHPSPAELHASRS